jgi:Mor family transcriptional regulator
MNGAATGVPEVARALGVKMLGGNDADSNPSNYKETPPDVSSGDWVAYGAEETVESNGKQVPRVTYDEKSMVYTVNKKHQQDDGTYSLKLKEGQSHYGKKWVTRVKDGKVERRLRNDQDMKTEQVPSMGEVSGGVTMSQGGKSVYIPAGKVIRFEGRNYKLEGDEGSYELVPTDEEVTWRAKDALKGFDDVMLKRKELRQNKKKANENRDKEAYKLAVDHPWISGWSNTRLR